MRRIHRIGGLLIAIGFLMVPTSTRAQRLSLAAGLDLVEFSGGNVGARDGLQSAHLAVRYGVTGRFQIGVGGAVGSFDVPGHGSSFTAYNVFLEPSVTIGRRRVIGYVGPRAGWEQERLGSAPSHVGGSFGLVAGLLALLNDRWAAGLRAQVDRLRLGAWKNDEQPSVRGQRLQVGAELQWTHSP